MVSLDLTIHVEKGDTESIVYLKGEIDIYTVEKIEPQLIPLTEKNSHTVLVNLEDVNYMDSTGLGLFIKALKSVKKHEGQLKLIHLQDRIERLFKITGLDEVIQIDSSTRCQ